MKRFAFLALLMAAPAMGQDVPLETVTAHGSSLVGVWHGGLIQFGLWNTIIPFSDPKLMGIIDGFCRIGLRKDAPVMSCLQTGDNPPMTVDGTHLHFAGGSFIGGGGFDGDQVSAGQLRGRYWVRHWGVRYENPSISLASRVTADATAPDKAGKAALLRRILEDGLAGVPQDAEAMKKNGPAFSPPQLGPVQAVIYLGQETKWDWPPPPETKVDMNHLRFEDIPRRPDFFSAYHVRFADGERLCGLHQREDGVLDAFRCV